MKRGSRVGALGVAAVFAVLAAVPSGRAEAAQGKQLMFTGRVLDAAGGPIGGIQVRFYQETYEDASSSYGMATAAQVATRADGSFSFRVSAESDSYQYGYIVAEKAGLAIGFATWDLRQDKKCDLTLGEAKMLAGVVVDEGGQPVPDAAVGIYVLQIDKTFEQNSLGMRLAPQLLKTRTDATGRFAFANLPAGGTAELLVRKPGKATVCTYAPRTFYGESMRHRVGQTDVRLTQPVEAKIEGVVVQKQTGQPLAGITLMVMYSGNRPLDGYDPAPVNADGTFTLPALPAGEYALQVATPRGKTADWVGAPVPVTVKAGQAVTGLKIEVSQGGLLEIAVTDAANDKPLEKASASVRAAHQGGQWFHGTSDAQGIARIRLAPGSYQLQGAFKQGYGYEGQPQTLAMEEGATKRVAVALKETPKLHGVVRDPAGAPVAGVRIRIMPSGGEDITSDAQGKFEAAWEQRVGPMRMNFSLLAQDEQRNLAAAIDLAEDMSTVDVKLEPGVTIAGRVADPNGKGIAGARIMPMLRRSMSSSSMSREPFQTDATGAFEIRAAPAQHRYELYASANGYGSKRSGEVETEAGKDRLDIGVLTLAPANLSVSGQVVDSEDRPVARAMISVSGFGDGQPDRLSTQTDAEGKFTLNGVCPGRLDLRVEITRASKRLSAQALTEGGSRDIKIVLREGSSYTVQRVGGKNYDQIVSGGGKIIAGAAVDEKGSPVAGVPVQVCCHKAMREGKMSWRFSDFRELSATTDAQGRFAIELKEDGEYNLRFSPVRLAALIVYDVPVGQKDLKVTLPQGGTVTGRLVRREKGRNIPVPNAEVKVEQTNRISFSHLGFDQDRTTTTDAEGRFRFEHLCTQIRTDYSQAVFLPRTWKLSHGEVSQTVAFDGEETTKEVDLVIKPDLANAPSLVGQPMPSLDGLGISLPAGQIKGQRVLVCFFDWEQRPSRNCVLQLAKQAPSLQEKAITVVAMHVSKENAAGLQKWATENKIPFQVGTLQGGREEVSFAWSIKSLPWLVLTDTNHTVTAEGFAPAELDRKLAETWKPER